MLLTPDPSVVLATAALVLSVSSLSSASPTVAGSTRFISIPLQQAHSLENLELHPTIVHQQHANRGLQRFARLSGEAEPTQLELLKNLHKRASDLSPALRKRFNHDGIEEAIEQLTAMSLANPPSPSLDDSSRFPTNQAWTESDNVLVPGFSPVALDIAIHHTVTKAYPPTFVNSIGLDIQANDIGYVGVVQIGFPPQDFRLLMDSGSADLWVGGEGCISNTGGSCGKHTFLGPTSSVTYYDTGKKWRIRYGSGRVQGHVVTDQVTVADLTLSAHKFGVAFNESKQFVPDRIPFDGLLGTAHSKISQQRLTTIPEALYNACLISEPVVAYKIPRVLDGKHDGEMSFGGMNPAKYDPKTLVTVDNASKLGFWEAHVEKVSVDGKILEGLQREVILDTGSTLFLAPKKDVAAIHALIPRATYKGGYWAIPCTTSVTLTLTIGGQDFPIDPRDLTFIPLDIRNLTGDCMSSITEVRLGEKGRWLVGDVFLKNVYFMTNARTDRISLARLADHD